jgi:hypothetical protein
MRDLQAWAESEFAHAELGDTRRGRRLVQIGVEAAGCPTGIVSKACRSQASQEGAFRFLENGAVHVSGIRAAIVTATLRRCREHELVIVPVDGSALSIADRRNVKGLGGVGAWNRGAKGVQTMTALAVSEAGATIGICAQRMWVRSKRSPHGARGNARGKQSENDFWLETLLDVRSRFEADAPRSQPWFQMDRGADCWQVLETVVREGLRATVRAAHDRRVDEALGRLWAAVEARSPVSRLKVLVPARPSTFKRKRVAGKRVRVRVQARGARIATVSLRAGTITLRCTLPSGAVIPVTINAVLVKEARAKDPIEWMLLTTQPIRTRRNVLAIVRAYTLRWRIEDFHRTWKRGLCRVEDTQLRSRNAIFKWATILATVATRALRLMHLARSTPTAPATSEFSDLELKAIVALRKPKDFDPSRPVDLATAVRWVADLGGYSRPKQGPPGPTVIGRGLYDVLVVARALQNLDQMR